MPVSEELPQGTSKRSAKMASIPLSLAGRGAIGFGRQLIGQSPDFAFADLQEKTAEQIFKVLGELKGGAMKLAKPYLSLRQHCLKILQSHIARR